MAALDEELCGTGSDQDGPIKDMQESCRQTDEDTPLLATALAVDLVAPVADSRDPPDRFTGGGIVVA